VPVGQFIAVHILRIFLVLLRLHSEWTKLAKQGFLCCSRKLFLFYVTSRPATRNIQTVLPLQISVHKNDAQLFPTAEILRREKLFMLFLLHRCT